MRTPLDDLPFPVNCSYAGCGEGPFRTAIEVDEHISEEHLSEAVWTFAYENMSAGMMAECGANGSKVVSNEGRRVSNG